MIGTRQWRRLIVNNSPSSRSMMRIITSRWRRWRRRFAKSKRTNSVKLKNPVSALTTKGKPSKKNLRKRSRSSLMQVPMVKRPWRGFRSSKRSLISKWRSKNSNLRKRNAKLKKSLSSRCETSWMTSRGSSSWERLMLSFKRLCLLLQRRTLFAEKLARSRSTMSLRFKLKSSLMELRCQESL